MDRVVVEFLAILRGHGLRVSPAEARDALEALRALGLGDRETVHDALRATLCKSAADTEAFDRLFALFFTLSPVPAGAATHGHGHGHPHPRAAEQLPSQLEADLGTEPERGRSDDHGDHVPGLRDLFDRKRLRQSPGGGHDQESDRLRLSLLAQQLVLNRRDDALDRVLRRATQSLRVRRARTGMLPGDLTLSGGGEEIPLDVAATELHELVEDLRALDVDPALLEALEGQAAALSAQLPELIAQLLARRRALGERLSEQVMATPLVAVNPFSESERRQLEAAIRRLAKRLHGTTSRRRSRGRRGELSLPHTVRRSLRYDGIPFQPAFRRRREHKPRLVVLCDVSLSTRNLARFWLQLVYQLQDLFSRVRTFVFVADVVEVTDLFREQPFERAVDGVFSGRLLDSDVNSDFGAAIGRFRDEYATALGRRTTVVILGDGRNNGRPPNTEALAEVARLARRVLWITPEPRWSWSLGACDLPRYEPLVERVDVVRTLDQLALVAEELAHPRPVQSSSSLLAS